MRFPQERETQTVHWLFDEIQLVEGWERFVRRIVDTENVFVVVSGSSARLLSREVHTSLRGRSMETIIRPFSFREFLRHRGAEPAGGAIHRPRAVGTGKSLPRVPASRRLSGNPGDRRRSRARQLSAGVCRHPALPRCR